MRGNKLIIFISLMLVTGIIIGLAVPNPGHNSDIVEFSLGGSRMTLQQAINGEKFLDSLPGTVAEIVPQNNGHTAKDIWVSINGVERTLEDSLKMNKGLCGSSAVAYSGKKDPGHLASEIKITLDDNEMTLQNAINVGKFCAKWTPSAWGGCSASCGGGTQTRTFSCTRGDGTPLNEVYCTDPKPPVSRACNTQACCNPKTTCSSSECGVWNDGCGGQIDCGGCNSGYTCTSSSNGICEKEEEEKLYQQCYWSDTSWIVVYCDQDRLDAGEQVGKCRIWDTPDGSTKYYSIGSTVLRYSTQQYITCKSRNG